MGILTSMEQRENPCSRRWPGFRKSFARVKMNQRQNSPVDHRENGFADNWPLITGH
jgi:hypothetical protein